VIIVAAARADKPARATGCRAAVATIPSRWLLRAEPA
jgi:hypothetical protein